jgi:hypothetical protein
LFYMIERLGGASVEGIKVKPTAPGLAPPSPGHAD